MLLLDIIGYFYLRSLYFVLDYFKLLYLGCRNPSFGLTTKAKTYKGVGQK
jgi:hypothetical protein